MSKNRDGYQVCIGDDGGVIEVSALTEAQAKEVLCRLIDKLESIETAQRKFHYQFQEWRNVKAPRK